MKKTLVLAAMAMSVLLLTSCATIISGKTADVTISGSVNDPREVVNIQTDVKTYTAVSLPAKVKVKRKKKPSTIKITSAYYTYGDIVVEKKHNPTIWLNMTPLSGGFIGLGVDALNGVMHKPKQKAYTAEMELKEGMSIKDRDMALLAKAVQTASPTNANVVLPQNGNAAVAATVAADRVPVADIDSNLPVAAAKAESTFAIIIANENYIREAKVPYAMNDGKVFREYCLRTFGLPENNVKYIENATLNDMKFHLGWLKNVLNAYKGEAKAIFYYAGHGVPDEANKTAYLLPVDGYGSDTSTGYSLKQLYAMLNEAPSAGVTVFLDACFSGAKREGGMMASARGIAIKVKEETPQGNMVVLSAAQGDETAYPYKDKGHGMFTYYLLKKIQQTGGDVTLGDLSEYVKENVSKTSIVLNGKSQTPSLNVAVSLGDRWKTWKLK